MRVLVIEDSAKMASLLRRGLTEEGYAVDVAANGVDGVWLATEQPFDAIVLDVVLPDIDGFEVCRRLRGQPRATGGADALTVPSPFVLYGASDGMAGALGVSRPGTGDV